MSDFIMGPGPEKPVSLKRITDLALGICYELTDEQKKALQEFVEERWRQFDADLSRGLWPPHGAPTPSGWQCPNCGKAHAPDVATCPEPPRGGSLRERLKEARNG